ncbi:MAG: ABC transporter permease [Bacteroidota bacterium]|nr:ABC transporter permease [Bacteroidota bacterium]MDP4211489.1 ABC transporter permease [Bacteroidota bacterium]MDP4249838.1 ABC transporter permease [Bacteroidota bacterium]
MLKNYFKIAFRNLWRHRVFSFINVIGLTISMTACFLIFLYVHFELSYDSFHSKADRIYRVVTDLKTPSEMLHTGGPSWAVGPHIVQEFPQLEAAVRTTGDELLVRKGNVKYQELNSLYADSAFFKVFDFKLLKGDPATALNEPLSIVFSQSAAKKYFGDQDPVGQTVLLTGDGLTAKITGLMEDMPENSLIKADMLVSMTTLTRKFNPGLDDQWGNYGNSTYILVKPGTRISALQAQFPAFLERRNGDEMKRLNMYPTLLLEPLKDVYLRSTRNGNNTGNINNVYIFSLVAVFILLIACFNFVNLTTARSAERAKEVGIRKVVGAMKAQLTAQFIGESVLLCVIAFLFTLGITALLLPSFNQLAGKIISTGVFQNGHFILLLLLAALGIGLLAGLYPALVLSSFKPVSVLKGRFSTGSRGVLLRKGLVVSQFTISITLIIATIIVYNQMNFMRNQDLGFNKDQMMVINTNSDPAKEAFRNAVSGMAGVKSVAMSSSVPGGGNPGAYSMIQNKKGEMQIANLDLYFVDFDYIPQYHLKLLAGRAFSRDFQTDTTQAMILNEAAIKLFGYSSPKEAIGRRFSQWGREGMIIGVMKDFHFRSLQQEIKPLSMRIEPNGCNLISINISAKNLPATISDIEKKWNALIPARPFSYFFLDDFFDKQYRSEERFGKLFLNFAALAVLISCLGLLGLASYSTMQRTREIGIRKVLGASVTNIVNLLSGEFLKLVAIAIIIASPIAWFAMHSWLQDFAYRIHISLEIFITAAILAALIALLTVSFQAIKAAVANPVNSLRTE